MKDGLDINKGNDIKPIVSLPKMPIFESKGEKKIDTKILQGMENIFNYDGSIKSKNSTKEGE